MNVVSSSRISPAPTAPRNSPFWNALRADVHDTYSESEGLNHLPYFDLTPTTSPLDPLPVVWGPGPDAREEEILDSLPDANGLWPQGIHPHILPEPIYRSTSGLSGLPIKHAKCITTIASGAYFCTYINTGILSDRRINYLSKSWGSLHPTLGFFTELSLFKSQLQELQGHVVPTIIGVYCNVGKISVAMESPHHSFWMEASSDMPDVLKRRCVEAFEKIHARGVCHGDVHLGDMVIGGDAKITILNFHASRALASNPAVGLRATNLADLQMEMRKVKFLLDYQEARQKEYSNYARRSPRIGDTEIKAQKSYQHSTRAEDQFAGEIEDIPEDIYRWLPFPAVPPKRFVMPGQTKAELEMEIQRFSNIVDALEMEAQPSCPSTSSRPPPPDDHNRPSSELVLAVPEACSGGARYNLRSRRTSTTPIAVPGGSQPARSRPSPSLSRIRKRKVVEDAGSGSRPIKKIRFSLGSHGLCEPLWNSSHVLGGDSGTLPNGGRLASQVEAHLPPIYARDFASSATSSKQRIINTNIQRCINLGLPHPDAITQDPDNPHWRHPHITEYIRRHNRQVEQAIQLIQRYPDRPSRVPRPRRSEGSLKRAMTAIAQARSKPNILVERSRGQTSLGKRKGEWEDGDSLSNSPTPPGMTKSPKRLRLGVTSSDTAHRSAWPRSPSQGTLGNPRGVMFKNRSGVANTGKPQRTPMFYYRGGHHKDHTLNASPSSSQPPPSPEAQIISSLPREKGRWASLSRGSTFFGDLLIQTPTDIASLTRISQPPWTEEGLEKFATRPVNDLGITLTMTPPYAGLLTRCMGGFRRLLH